MRTSTRFRRSAVPVVLTALMVSGCAMPQSPQALSEDYVPPPAVPSAVPPGAGSLTPAGFSLADEMTLRVRADGCIKVTTGTAFPIDEHTAITNRHVIENANAIELTTFDGSSFNVSRAVVTDLADLAILTTDEKLTLLPDLETSDPETAQDVFIVGYPLGGKITTTYGVVLGSVEDPLGFHDNKVFVTDATVDHGSSGSAVLDEDGNVIGVVYAKNTQGHAFFIPISTVQELLNNEATFEEAPTCQMPSPPEPLAPSFEPPVPPEPIPSETPTDEPPETN